MNIVTIANFPKVKKLINYTCENKKKNGKIEQRIKVYLHWRSNFMFLYKSAERQAHKLICVHKIEK